MHSCELIHELLDKQERGGIADGECVQLSIILDWSEIAILLFDKDGGECIGGLQLMNVPFLEVLCNELLQSDVFGQQ